MNCPKCGYPTKVADSRDSIDGMTVVRRRRCLRCDYRFTTREFADIVIKKRGPALITTGAHPRRQKRRRQDV